MKTEMKDIALVLDIGGTTTRAARLVGDSVDKVVQCPTPTVLMAPDVSVEFLQSQLVELSAELIAAVTLDATSLFDERRIRVAITFSGRVSDDGRLILSAPDIWGTMTQPFPLAASIEERLAGRVDVRMCSDVVALASQYADRVAHADQRFALLIVRTGIKYTVSNASEIGDNPEPVLLGHLPMPGTHTGYECTCGATDHITTTASATGAANVLIRSALVDPKRFRSSMLFELAARRFSTLRFEQRLSLLRRHAVRRNARAFIDDDVWRNMHDKHEEITPGELQRWMFPVLLDAGMFIDAVRERDRYALELLDVVTEPVALHLREHVLDYVDVVALTGGFARALGEQYRSRITPASHADVVRWAHDDALDDLRATRALLFPRVVDVRDGALTTQA
jgi:predicted NBD/HSP70 family sugar kinase